TFWVSWDRRTCDFAGQLASQSQDGEVVLGQTYNEFLITLDLAVGGDFVLNRWQIEMAAEETVSLQAMIELIVVRSRIPVLMPLKICFLAIQPIDRLDCIIDQWLY